MKLHDVGPWPDTPQEAIALQRRLATQVSQRDELPLIPRLVAGIDISGEDAQGRARGAVVLLRWEDMAVVEVQTAEEMPTMPYVPGLLAFRELPVIMGALERLEATPDLVLVDGQGLAHPRRFGIACHIGLITQVPTVGCAKSILRGRFSALGQERSAWAELVDGGEVVGAAVRSREKVSPIYISVGHKIELATATRLVLDCCRGYRLPEPTRKAHLAAGDRLPTDGALRIPELATIATQRD